MSSQLIIYLVLALFLAGGLRRYLRHRSVPRRTPQEAEEQVRSGLGIFLDVRTDGEWRQDHIKGSTHIPLQSLKRRTDELKKHANKEIICYCQSGNRSVNAAAVLRGHGLNASSMEGGIGEWNFVHRIKR